MAVDDLPPPQLPFFGLFDSMTADERDFEAIRVQGRKLIPKLTPTLAVRSCCNDPSLIGHLGDKDIAEVHPQSRAHL